MQSPDNQLNICFQLPDSIKDKLPELYNKCDFIPLEQDYLFPIESRRGKIVYAYVISQDKIIFFCRAVQYKKMCFKHVKIIGAPIFEAEETAALYLSEFLQYWYNNNFFLIWEPFFYNHKTYYYVLNKLKIPYHIVHKQFVTLLIDLKDPYELIFRNYSKGHKSAVKKGIKEGLEVRKAVCMEQISAFSQIYSDMIKKKKLNFKEDFEFWEKLFYYFSNTGIGHFYLVYDREGTVLGGIVVVYQGKYARYFKGTAVSEVKLPVLHLALDKAIQDAQSQGLNLFDMWGVDFFAEKGSQTDGINVFKKGFSKDFFFFPFNIQTYSRYRGYISYLIYQFYLKVTGHL